MFLTGRDFFSPVTLVVQNYESVNTSIVNGMYVLGKNELFLFGQSDCVNPGVSIVLMDVSGLGDVNWVSEPNKVISRALFPLFFRSFVIVANLHRGHSGHAFCTMFRYRRVIRGHGFAYCAEQKLISCFDIVILAKT
jgi:hypothetical protein